MKSLPTKVPLGIVTTPAGVSIRISKTNQSCVTPDCNIKLAPGNYEIEAELEGYESATKSISVGAQGTNAVDIAMVPSTPSQPVPPTTAAGTPVPEKPGQLVIRGVPAGAQVLVDGALKGKATNRGAFSTSVPAGEHQVSIIAKNESPNPITRQFPAGGRVELSQPDFKIAPPPPSPPSTGSVPRPEESDWARVKDSVNADDVNAYLKRYPSGVHKTEADSKLDDIYWAQAKNSNSLSAIRDYVNRYQHGRHADEAQGEIARLDWQAVANTNDSGALDDFLKRYPSGQYHDRALARADEVLWSRTTHDAAGLNTYLQKFPSGKHADEAHSTIQQLSKKTVPEENPDEVLWAKLDKKDKSAIQAFLSRRPTAHRADAQAILDQMAVRDTQKKDLQQPLDLFNAAFEHQQPKELKDIWPGATDQYVKALRPPAGYKVSIKLQATGDPTVSGDKAQVPCDLISETTGPGIQPKQNRKAVRVSLYKNGDRWLISDPFGQ